MGCLEGAKLSQQGRGYCVAFSEVVFYYWSLHLSIMKHLKLNYYLLLLSYPVFYKYYNSYISLPHKPGAS